MKHIEFKEYNVKINSGDLVSVIGPNGCGKTYLLKKICNMVKTNSIYIDNKNINSFDLQYKRSNIVCVFDDNIYSTNSVIDELCFYIKKIVKDKDIVELKINDFKDYFKIDNIYNKDFFDLSVEDRIYIKILSLLIIKPSIFCIDDLLTYLSNEKKTRIINYIKDNSITLINVTSNMEELLLCDYIMVMNKGNIIKKDLKEEILDDDSLFKDLGLSLPFIYDINNLLLSYDLINNKCIIEKELVNVLWK